MVHVLHNIKWFGFQSVHPYSINNTQRTWNCRLVKWNLPNYLSVRGISDRPINFMGFDFVIPVCCTKWAQKRHVQRCCRDDQGCHRTGWTVGDFQGRWWVKVHVTGRRRRYPRRVQHRRGWIGRESIGKLQDSIAERARLSGRPQRNWQGYYIVSHVQR